MKAIKFFIRGDFDSAYLYRGRLILFSRYSCIAILELSDIVDKIQEKFPYTAPFIEWCFAKNEWLSNDQSRSLLKHPLLFRLFNRWLTTVQNWQPDLELTDFRVILYEAVKNCFDTVLDCVIYNGRIYFATDNSLYHIDADWLRKRVAFPPTLTKRLDTRCVSLSARYGAINASSAHDGLFSAFNEFPTTGESFREPSIIDGPSWKSDWCSYDIVNYDASFHPRLLRTTREPVSKEKTYERDKLFLTSVSEVKQPLSSFVGKESPEGANARFEDSRFVFNLNQNFYTVNSNNEIDSLKLSYPRHSNRDEPAPEPQLRANPQNALSSQKLVDEVLSTCTMPVYDGLVFETCDSVKFLSKDGIITLIDEPAVAVKTYPKSIDYQNLVTVVVEDGVWLICMVDENV